MQTLEAELTSTREGSQVLQRKLDRATEGIVELQKSNNAFRIALAEVTSGQGRKRSRNTDWEMCSDRHK